MDSNTKTPKKLYKRGYDEVKIEEDNLKPNKVFTRSRVSAKVVLEYTTFTRTINEGCSYFRSLLNDNKNDEFSTNVQGNFVLNIFLPLSMVGSITYSSRKRIQSRTTLTGFPFPIERIEEVIAGSSSDGLGLPQITHIKGQSFYVEIPDEDTKYIFSKLIIHPFKKDAFAYSEPSPQSPSCFIKLRYNPASRLATEKTKGSVSFHKVLTADGYFNRNKFVRLLLTVLKGEVYNIRKESETYKCKDGTQPSVSFQPHGPAVSVDVKDEVLNTVLSKDYIISLPCPQWPEQAKSWPKRKRIWPSQGIVRKVIREGCHIVPKAYNTSLANSTEFMFSFSMADITVSKSLSLNQKRSCMIFKYVFKHFLNTKNRGLKSYFCKTVFLWRCETKPECEWREDNILDCLVLLLEDLKSYLTKRFLPHYYIPDCNLIFPLSERCLETCIDSVQEFLQAPWQIITNLSDSHRFLWISRDVSLRTFLLHLSPDISVSRQLLCDNILTFLSALLDKGNTPLVMSILCQAWSADSVIEVKVCIKALESLIENHKDHAEIVSFKGILANLYHEIYEEGQVDSNLKQCAKIFEDVNQIVENHIWILGAYYDHLLSLGYYKEIVIHFIKYLHPVSSETGITVLEAGIYTSISCYNRLTTLPDDFSYTDFFLVPSTAYILYKIVLAYLGLAFSENSGRKKAAFKSEARKVLRHLEIWTNRKSELYPELFDDQLYHILGKAAHNVGDMNLARFAFQEVLKYGMTFGCIEFSDDECSDESEVIESSRTSRRFHPYKKSTHYRKTYLPENMIFKPFRPVVGPFIHY